MRLKGQILATDPNQVLFQVGHKTSWLPKSEIRLEPHDYHPGPHTVYLPGWLAERVFGTPRRPAPGVGVDEHPSPY